MKRILMVVMAMIIMLTGCSDEQVRELLEKGVTGNNIYVVSQDSLSGTNITQLIFNVTYNSTLDKYVNESGDTMYGALKVNVSGSQIGHNGEDYQAYIRWGELDLTGIGFGKYAELQGISDGTAGDIFGIKEGMYISAYTGNPTITMFDTNTLTSQTLFYDIGADKMTTNGDFYCNGELSADVLNPTVLTIGDGTASNVVLNFDALNYDGNLTFWDSGGGGSVKYAFGGIGDIAIPSKIAKINGGLGDQMFNYMDMIGSNDIGKTFGSYGTPNAGYIANNFLHGGAEIPSTAYMLRMVNMLNHVFDVGGYGDMTIGINSTDIDYNVSFNMRGRNNTGVIKWLGDEAMFEIIGNVSDITMKEGKGLKMGSGFDNYIYSLSSSALGIRAKSKIGFEIDMTEIGEWDSDGLIIGGGTEDKDYRLNFHGQFSDGTIIWSDEEELFNISTGDITINSLKGSNSTLVCVDPSGTLYRC